jgi:transcriptional regulator with XRE-family HTH domain
MVIDQTAKILAKLMAARDLNQADLARATGVNQPTISRILSSGDARGIKSPSDKQVRPIAHHFGITVDQLRGYQDLDIDGVFHMAEETEAAFSGKEIDDPIAWLQMLRDVRDPEVVQSLRNIVRMFSKGSLSSEDARAIEEITKRFFRSTSPQRRQA